MPARCQFTLDPFIGQMPDKRPLFLWRMEPSSHQVRTEQFCGAPRPKSLRPDRVMHEEGIDARGVHGHERVASLTAQQIRVLLMLKEGLLNKQIAHALNVSEATVKAHVSAILLKLGVASRTQAVIAASKLEGL